MATPEDLQEPKPGVYRIDPDASTIRFATRSLFGLVPVKGTFAIEQGQLAVAESAADSTVDVVVRADSFDTGNAKRDEHVRSADFLHVSDHPEIRFRSQGPQRDGEATLHGELTVQGVSQPSVLTIESVTVDDAGLTVRAGTTVDRYAFGVTKSKGMAGRYLSITLDVVAAR
ncbi:MAG: YceI family protein [Actinocatenispora sp.]